MMQRVMADATAPRAGSSLRVALSTIGKFHSFDLARELHRHNALAGIYSGYPRFKLQGEGLPQEMIHTFPWLYAAYMAYPWKHRLPTPLLQAWEHLNAITFSHWVARQLPRCQVYVGLSGSTLAAGTMAQRRGARYVCDRGSAHIRVQDALLREEHALWDMPFTGIDPRNIAREEAEYAQADGITVPSTFALRSFVAQGVPASKLHLLPYGVNLSRFQPVASPAEQGFDVLFVGAMTLQKGVQYLVQAFNQVQHPHKTLTFAGTMNPALIALLKARGLWPAEARCLGHVPQAQLKELMSRSHVMVLPSIQEGFGMVMAQAMACGCPVIASRNTGAEDLFEDGHAGFIVPVRDSTALAQRLQRLADDRSLRARLGAAALARVQQIGGWDDYGRHALAIYRQIGAATA